MGNLAVKVDQVQRQAGSWKKAHEFSVLIIDEANRTRAQITQLLRHKGIENSVEANNGTEAMKLLAGRLQKGSRLPDLIIYNVSYEVEDRVQFCVKLRELGTPEFRNLPIILLASQADERLDLLVSHIGAAMVVVRPVSPEKMSKYIRYMIAKAKA